MWQMRVPTLPNDQARDHERQQMRQERYRSKALATEELYGANIVEFRQRLTPLVLVASFWLRAH